MAEIVLQPMVATPAGAAAVTAAASLARVPPELAAMAVGTIIQAVVAGREPGGQVLRTQYGAVLLRGAPVLPLGATVTLQLQSAGAQVQVALLSLDGAAPSHAAATREASPQAHPAAAIVRLAPGLASLPAGAIVQAIVVGREAGNLTVLRAPQGPIALQGAPPVPVGATVMLQLPGPGQPTQATIIAVEGAAPPPATVRDPTAPAAAPNGGPASTAPLPPSPAPAALARGAALLLAERWPALADALEVLTGRAPDAARALADILPRPGPDLAERMLAFIAALRGGNLWEWTGRAAQRELNAAGRAALAALLGDDFAELSRLAAGDAGGEWRAVPVPILADGTLQQLRLFYRGRRRAAQHGRDGDPGTRLLIDVELTRLGRLQLDGLVQRRRFDLIVRARQALAPEMRRDIAAIFHEAREAAGLSGDIAFLATRDFLAPPILAGGHDALGVTA
jgi:hypothetical protein